MKTDIILNRYQVEFTDQTLNMQTVNLVYWKCKTGSGNFGDEISVFITGQLINSDKYRLIFNKTNADYNLICIGSYTAKARDNYYIFGSGVRTLDQMKHYTNLNISAVRGPLTKKYFTDHGIKCPDIFGDPALLLRKYYKPHRINNLEDKIGLIPHFTNMSKYTNMKLDERFHLINPCSRWTDVVDQIYSCWAVVSSSLHGIICSDAYDIPNLWIDEFPLQEGTFKFEDYFMSQKRNIVKISSLEEYDDNLLYTDGNKIDINRLIKAFPFSN